MRDKPTSLLYFAYYFPPIPAIAAVRAWNTVKSLVNLGWRVTVVTPDPKLFINHDSSGIAEKQIKDLGVAMIFTGHAWPMLEPGALKWVSGPIGWLIGGVIRVLARNLLKVEGPIGWGRSVKLACSDLKPGDFDLVLATVGPSVAAEAAKHVANRIKSPFVLDYRDLVFGNPHGRDCQGAAIYNKEMSLVREAAAITVVSKSMGKVISDAFGVGDKVRVISNGFDSDMFSAIQPCHFDHFALVYAGVLYPPKRVLTPILKAFVAFVQTTANFSARFHYYGPDGKIVVDEAKQTGAEKYLVIHREVSRGEALAAQKGAGLVVVVASVSEAGTLAENGIVTAKIFDCMAMHAPALIIAPLGSDLYEITMNAGGMKCFAGTDIERMTEFISEVASGNKPRYFDQNPYQWRVLGGELADVLCSAIKTLR